MRSRLLPMIVALVALLPGLALAGAPLKGVDVKLGKPPGGSVSARMDGHGGFEFPVMPAGQYVLELVGVDGVVPNAATLELMIRSGRVVISKTVTVAAATARKAGSVIFQVEVKSDGTTPIMGSLVASD